MYRVTIRQGWNGKPTMIHSPYLNGVKLPDAKVVKDVAAAASFNFTIYPNSNGYSNLHPYSTFVNVERIANKDGPIVLFEGRVLIPKDSMNDKGVLSKQVTCEGLLAFLHDSIQDYGKYQNMTPSVFLGKLLDVHNRQVESCKQIKLGRVTVTNSTDNVYRYTDDSKDTYDTIKEKLLDRLGGELQLRHEADGLYLDYLTEVGHESKQEIRIAKNLRSLTRNIDPTEIATVLKPLGAREEAAANENGNSDASAPRLTISSVNNGSTILRDESKIAEFGVQVKAQTWDDVHDAGILMTKGKSFLASQRTALVQYEMSAVDLSLIDLSVEDFQTGNYHHTYNPLMGIDETLRIIGQTIDLTNPANSTLSIGDKILNQEDFNRQLAKAQQAVDELQNEVNFLGSDLVNLSMEFSKSNDLVDNLKASVETMKQNLGDQDLSGITGTLAGMTQQLESLSQGIGSMPAQIAENQNAISGLVEKYNGIVQRLAALEDGTGGTTNE